MVDGNLLDVAAIVWAWWERRPGETIDDHVPQLRRNLELTVDHEHEGDCAKAVAQGPWTCPRCVADDLIDVARRIAAVPEAARQAARAARLAARDVAFAPARRAKEARRQEVQEHFLAIERRRAEMLARHEAGQTYTEIGRAFGITGTTVAYHCRKAMWERQGWRSRRIRTQA